MLGILVYRVASFALMVVLAAVVEMSAGRDVGAARRDRRGSPRSRGSAHGSAMGPVGRRGALLLAAPFLAAEGHLIREPVIASAYLPSSVMLWAAMRGVPGGLAAAIVLAIPLAAARWLGLWSDHSLGAVLSIFTGSPTT